MRCRGVRNANAYILVYDICCVESFEYVKMIRQQIVDHRYGQQQLLYMRSCQPSVEISNDIPLSQTRRQHVISQSCHEAIRIKCF